MTGNQALPLQALGGGAVPGPPSILEVVQVVASGLEAPEGPVSMADGSVFVVETHRGRITKVAPDGTVGVLVECGGGPNGLAIGPDGALYVCNRGLLAPDYTGAQIERVDLATGTVDVLYTECDGSPLSAPNDLVFDADGGFWFTDLGKNREQGRDHGRIFYARPDGSDIRLVFDRVGHPNGIGLSHDGETLYFAETFTARLYKRHVTGFGEVEHARANDGASLLCGLPGLQWMDSLEVDDQGRICVATMLSGCITAVAPDGLKATQFLLPNDVFDSMPTNMCIDAVTRRHAYVTLRETGKLIKCVWPPSGLQ